MVWRAFATILAAISLLVVPPPAIAGPITKVPSGATPTCTIKGTPDADILDGTARRDVICGLGGDDVIRASGGDDVVLGGQGDDVIYGGGDYDELVGGAGADRLFGGVGSDRLFGGRGSDRLMGNPRSYALHRHSSVHLDTFDGGPGRNHCSLLSDDRFIRCGSDESPPQVVEWRVSKVRVDATSHDRHVYLLVHVRDDVAATNLSASVEGTSQGGSPRLVSWHSDHLDNVWYRVTIVVPRYTPARWLPATIAVGDSAGRTTNAYLGDVVEVIDTNPDLALPSLELLRLSPTADVSDSDAVVTATFRATDNLSGVESPVVNSLGRLQDGQLDELHIGVGAELKSGLIPTQAPQVSLPSNTVGLPRRKVAMTCPGSSMPAYGVLRESETEAVASTTRRTPGS